MCLGDLGLIDTAIFILCMLATLGTLAVISRDRYLAVTKPWWYRYHVNTSRAIKMSSIPWIISVVITLTVCYVPYKFEGEFKHVVHTISLVYYFFGFVIIIFSHLGIYFKKTPVVGIREMQAVRKREKKSAATIIIRFILLVLLLTFLPALLWQIVLKLKGIESLEPYLPFTYLLFTLNAFVNPLLNFGRNKDMRRALRGLLWCFQNEQQQQHQQQQQQHQHQHRQPQQHN